MQRLKRIHVYVRTSICVPHLLIPASECLTAELDNPDGMLRPGLFVSVTLPYGAKKALDQLPRLRGCQVHTSVMLSDVDIKVFKKLGAELTSAPVYAHKNLYH